MPKDSSRGLLPLLVVTGMAKEMRLAAGPGSIEIGSGGDPQRLRTMLAARAQPLCRAVISFGIAGGLDPALKPGDIIVSTSVVAGMERWQPNRSLADRLAACLAGGGLRPIRAALAGEDFPVVDAAAKRALRRATGAAAADMESHVAAAYAARVGLPFAALRVVCDPAERGLPPLALQALRPDGAVDLPAVARSLARQPAQLASLLRLADDARRAFRALGRCRDLLGIGRGFPDLGEFLRDVA